MESEMVALERVDSLAERAYRALRERIATGGLAPGELAPGELAPGERVTERGLAEQAK